MNSRYIIFADDDADDLELITGFFKQYNKNTNVLVFRDGKEVIQYLDDFARSAVKPLLIVLDINMPRLNGRETLAAIRKNQHYKNIPVVIYTTTITESDKHFYEKHGASWVPKSTNIEGVKQTARILADFCSSNK
ncbi:MAG: response regulator [Flavisolibacter sp.]|jgi:CheY-like chemotaxis protein